MYTTEHGMSMSMKHEKVWIERENVEYKIMPGLSILNRND